jgi:hypothetical protein
MKAPNLKQLEKSAADFNRKHPIGTPVMRYKIIDPLEDGNPTKTRSAAWVMGGHSVMVMVEGVSGGVLLESVVAIQHTESEPTRKS